MTTQEFTEMCLAVAYLTPQSQLRKTGDAMDALRRSVAAADPATDVTFLTWLDGFASVGPYATTITELRAQGAAKKPVVAKPEPTKKPKKEPVVRDEAEEEAIP